MAIPPPSPMAPPLPVNENSKLVYEMLKDGTAFNRKINTEITSTKSTLSLPVTDMQKTASFFGTSYAGGGVTTEKANGILDNFTTHVDGHFSKLSENLQLSASSENLTSGLSGGGLGGMCQGISDAFGSIMGGGSGILSSINGIIGQMGGALGSIGGSVLPQVNGILQQVLSGNTAGLLPGVISAAQGLLGQTGNQLFGSLSQMVGMGSGIVGQIQSIMGGNFASISNMIGSLGGPLMSGLSDQLGNITSMISGELGNLGGMVSKLLTMAGAGSLKSLFNHPCANGVLNAVGSSGLLSALGKR